MADGFLLDTIRAKAPLVHHITNWVTIYDCAQVVKALGASPVMSHAQEDVAEMAAIASAVVLNIGTLTTASIASMKQTALVAKKRAIPVVLDVCGAGATQFRNAMTADLLETGAISILKGNASEIASVAGLSVATKGVDSGSVDADLEHVAQSLARDRDATVVVTGPTDIVTDGTVLYRVKNGHPLMAAVVGTGCMATSVIGTFAAVEPNLAFAAAEGLAIYEIAAEIAAQTATGPMAFKAALLDTLYSLNAPLTTDRRKVETCSLTKT